MKIQFESLIPVSIITLLPAFIPNRPNLGDGAHSLGPAFPEDQPLFRVQVLRGLNEAEVHGGLVSCPQTVSVHA